MQTFLKGCKSLHLCSEVSYQFPRVVMLILRPAVIQTAMSQQDLISSQILGKKNYLWMGFLKILLYFFASGISSFSLSSFMLLEFFYIWLRFGCKKAEDICMEVGPRRWLGPPLFRYLRCKIGVQWSNSTGRNNFPESKNIQPSADS